MITFIDLTFSPNGSDASVVSDRSQHLEGISSVMGEHDLLFHWNTAEEFSERLKSIHEALAGTEAT